GLLLIARRQAGALGNEPDLEEMDRLGWRRVELAVDDAGAGAHALHLAGPYHGAVAEAVLVLERAGQHVGQDVHVPMAVRRESRARNDAILVDHAQGAEAHLHGIVVIGEGEAVSAVEPAGAAAAARHAITKRDHRLSAMA